MSENHLNLITGLLNAVVVTPNNDNDTCEIAISGEPNEVVMQLTALRINNMIH